MNTDISTKDYSALTEPNRWCGDEPSERNNLKYWAIYKNRQRWLSKANSQATANNPECYAELASWRWSTISHINQEFHPLVTIGHCLYSGSGAAQRLVIFDKQMHRGNPLLCPHHTRRPYFFFISTGKDDGEYNNVIAHLVRLPRLVGSRWRAVDGRSQPNAFINISSTNCSHGNRFFFSIHFFLDMVFWKFVQSNLGCLSTIIKH